MKIVYDPEVDTLRISLFLVFTSDVVKKNGKMEIYKSEGLPIEVHITAGEGIKPHISAYLGREKIHGADLDDIKGLLTYTKKISKYLNP